MVVHLDAALRMPCIQLEILIISIKEIKRIGCSFNNYLWKLIIWNLSTIFVINWYWIKKKNRTLFGSMVKLMQEKLNSLEEFKQYFHVLNTNKLEASSIVSISLEKKRHHSFVLMREHLILFSLAETSMLMLNYFLKVMVLCKKIKMSIQLKDGKEFQLSSLLITFHQFYENK